MIDSFQYKRQLNVFSRKEKRQESLESLSALSDFSPLPRPWALYFFQFRSFPQTLLCCIACFPGIYIDVVSTFMAFSAVERYS